MAKYLGIPLTVSNGNKVPLTAQPELVDTTVTQSSDWFAAATSPSTASITSDGGLVNVVSGNFAYVRTSVNSLFTIGKSYTATVRFQRISGSGGSVGVRQTIGSPLVIKNLTGGIQEITYNFTAYVDDQLYILREGTGDYSFLVSYVSVKEIAATETPTYGSPELVTNGEFATDSDWAKGTGVSISNNAMNFTSQGGKYGSQTINIRDGVTYKINFEITTQTSGQLTIFLGGGNNVGLVSGLGEKEIIASADTSIDTNIYFGDVFSGSITNVSVKEIPYVMGTREFVKNGDFSDGTNGWDATNEAELSISSGRLRVTSKTANYAYGYQYIHVEAGKTYRFTGDVHYVSGAVGWLIVDGFDENNVYHEYGIVSVNSSTTTNSLDITFVAKTNLFTVKGQVYDNPSGLAVEIDNISVKELEYNYLQVADGGFTKSVKEGDVVFNTSTGTEGVVKEVIDNNVLLMSNDNFSTADEFFNVFAANGDTRGNQLIKTDNYIMSEYDENTSNPQESSFWFAGGKNSDKVVLTQLNPATNTFFVAGVIEEYLERLNSQSATDSRLDIPLDAFRDHQYNEILTTTAITLS